MRTVWEDIRFALRSFRQQPAVVLFVVLAMALGIGANTAIFSVIDGLLFEQLNYEDPDRIVLIMESNPTSGRLRFGISPPNFDDFRRQSTVFEAMMAYTSVSAAYTEGDRPIRMAGSKVTHGFFEVLGVDPILGRGFTAEEDSPAGEKVVVLSYSTWQRLFGGEREILGQQIRLNGEPRTVIGVMPEGFRLLSEMQVGNDFWMPFGQDFSQMPRRFHFLISLARLKPGQTVETARAELGTITKRLEEQYPKTNQGWGAVVDPLHERLVSEVRPALLILWGAVGFVLLIACANVANLMLVRLKRRYREIAMRRAMGAGYGRLIRLLLTECILLALCGGALGVLMGNWAINGLLKVGADTIPMAENIQVDGRILIFAVAISVLTGLLFGLMPIRHALRQDLVSVLKSGGRSGAEGRSSAWSRNTLVMVEVALALTVLLGAGLLLRSLAQIQNVSLGFEPENVLTMEISLPSERYPSDGPSRFQFFERLLDRLRQVPGVMHAGIVSVLPLSDFSFSGSILVEGERLPPIDEAPVVTNYVVSPDYFQAMGIPLLEGRGFEDSDGPDGAPVVLVSKTAAEQLWSSPSPVGRRITSDDLWNAQPDDEIYWLTVVGVVGDVRSEQVIEAGGPAIYYPFAQNVRRTMDLVLRTGVDPLTVLGPIEEAVWSVDLELPVYDTMTLESHVASTVTQPRFNAFLLALFALLALTLAALGIYGVISHSVTQQRREIGIRMALGAQRGQIFSWVLQQGMRPVLIGLVVGAILSLFSAQLLSSLLFGLTATDPATYITAILLLFGVAALACVLPAYRALTVSPSSILKEN